MVTCLYEALVFLCKQVTFVFSVFVCKQCMSVICACLVYQYFAVKDFMSYTYETMFSMSRGVSEKSLKGISVKKHLHLFSSCPLMFLFSTLNYITYRLINVNVLKPSMTVTKYSTNFYSIKCLLS